MEYEPHDVLLHATLYPSKQAILQLTSSDGMGAQILPVFGARLLFHQGLYREKEHLKLKRGRILKQHREGHMDDEEFEGEMVAVELALRRLEVPEIDGVSLEDVIEAGERLPGMAA